MDFPHWNPVSFYEHMGYSRVEKSGLAVLVWKPFNGTVSPPSFQRQVQTPIADTDNISVMMFTNGWCTGNCSQLITVREAVEGLEGSIDYREIDTSEQQVLQEWGIADGLYVDGQPYRPYEPPCTSEMLRQDLVDMVARGGGRGVRPR